MKVRVDGQLVFNNLGLRLNSVLAGNGLSYLPEDQVQQSLQSGALIRVLDDWCPYYSGYHLYYPNRKHLSVAFSLVIDALRYSSRT